MSGSWKQDGLEPERYIIEKASGEPTDPDAEYFVLRYDKDPHARKALAAYAASVEADNKQLAQDIFDELERTRFAFNRHMESVDDENEGV